MTKRSNWTRMLTSRAAVLISLAAMACVARPGDDPAAPHGDVDKSEMTLFEDWLLQRFETAEDIAGYCDEVGDAEPIIYEMTVDEYMPSEDSPLVAISIHGCRAGQISFIGIISGWARQELGMLYLTDANGYSWSTNPDGVVEALEDKDVDFAFDIVDYDVSCAYQFPYAGSPVIETATRDIALRQPPANYNTARHLGRVQGSTLRGTRAVAACQ